MKNLYKTILAGMTAFWAACSNESSVDQSVAGATTEPSTSPTAELTEEQKAILARSFYAIVDSAKVDSLKEIIGTDDRKIYDLTFIQWHVTDDQIFSYPSKDGRKTCDVVTYYPGEFAIPRDHVYPKKVLRATSYDVQYYCDADNDMYDCAKNDYLASHYRETIINTQIIDVDSISVVMETVESSHGSQFWGYGVSCGEFLNEFKRSCSVSNGLFVDLADGCESNYLRLACASFAPEGKTPDDILDSYTKKYINQCIEDSIKYAPYDDENYTIDTLSDALYRDSVKAVLNLREEWYYKQKRSINAYKWQFTVIDSTIGFVGDEYPMFHYEELEDFAQWGYAHLAYNTLPDTKIADAYRKEGIYILPDSLVAEFFPTLATNPAGINDFKLCQRYRNNHTWCPAEVFYIIVLKDVGAKGHALTVFDGIINVTDFVKSGNCPEDTSVHYSMFLMTDSPDWDVLDRPITRTTYVSDNWNCDKPESLERIDPYGEWVPTSITSFEDWFTTFEIDRYYELKDKHLEELGGKDLFIDNYGEELYQEVYGHN